MKFRTALLRHVELQEDLLLVVSDSTAPGKCCTMAPSFPGDHQRFVVNRADLDHIWILMVDSGQYEVLGTDVREPSPPLALTFKTTAAP